MAKIFYDHLVRIEEIFIEFEKYDVQEEEKAEFTSLIDETVHERLLNLILLSLPGDFQEEFLTLFHQNPGNQEIIDYLKKQTIDIEEKIEKEAAKIKKEILADIKKSRKQDYQTISK